MSLGTQPSIGLAILLAKNIASKEEDKDASTSVKSAASEQLARSIIETRAAAWEEAEKAKYLARFKREEMKIQAWENNQRAKSEAEMRKVEVEIKWIRRRAHGKLMNKVAAARHKAEEKRAAAEAKKNQQAAKTEQQAEHIHPRYRWYVIEERGDQETAADDELGEKHWIRKSVKDRVRDLRLPQFNYDIQNAYFAVSNSRLFFVGGRTGRDHCIVEDNGILHIDLQQQRSDLSWKRCDKWSKAIRFVNGAVVSDNGNSIHAMADRVLQFNCRNVEGGYFLPPLPCWPSFLLASSSSNLLLYKPPYSNKLGFLGNFSMDIYDCCMCSHPSSNLKPWLFRGTLLVRDFLICFADFHPMANTRDDYRPALYVYNVVLGEWLSEPRDVLKFALVWSIDMESDEDDVVSDQTEVHWFKFILRIPDKEGQDEDNTHTLHAECLSSGAFYGGNTLLINCSAG
ncbi:hypothetical protein ACLB2K_036216 [Fragaria x ananassa]